MTRPAPIAAGLRTRRRFCVEAALLASGASLAANLGLAQQPAAPATPTRPDVAAIDRGRILAAADRFLAVAPSPLPTLPCPRSPGTAHDYFSDATFNDAPTSARPPFVAHRDAVFALGLGVPALVSAWLLTGESRYADHAAKHLRAWFVAPATRMTPSLTLAQYIPPPDTPVEADVRQPIASRPGGHFQGIVETLPLVDVARAVPFLAPTLSETDSTGILGWFAEYLGWLTAPEDSGLRLPALARDQKDHHASSWLLQASAYRLLAVAPGDVSRSEDDVLTELRRRFHSVTLRAQISPQGTFPHELGSPNPYRDSLFNLDLVAGVCELLSTRMERAWDYQLEDGPGMRAAIAFHYPFIADRGLWPFRADSEHFTELPGRRPSLLFCARAYQRPEYAALWKQLTAGLPTPALDRTIPMHQPLLWVERPVATRAVEPRS